MQVQVTFNLSMTELMMAVAMLMGDSVTVSETHGTPAKAPDAPKDAPVTTEATADTPVPSGAPQGPFRTRADVLTLAPGDDVHWQGQRFIFSGVVLQVLTPSSHQDSVIRIQRHDTGKVVRLTLADLAVGNLTRKTYDAEACPGCDDCACQTPDAVPFIRTNDDLNALHRGAGVHWKGQKFTFNGTIDDVFNGSGDDVVVRVRRDDTGKIVTLTHNDLQIGELSFL